MQRYSEAGNNALDFAASAVSKGAPVYDEYVGDRRRRQFEAVGAGVAVPRAAAALIACWLNELVGWVERSETIGGRSS